MTKFNSQNKRILQYLNEGNEITALDALKLFDCFRLSGRIYDLRRRGAIIESYPITTLDGKRIAGYRIKRPVYPA